MNKRAIAILMVTAAALIAWPLAILAQQASNPAPTKERTRAELELALAVKDKQIAELKREMVIVQGQLLDAQKQNLYCAGRDIDQEKQAADKAVKDRQDALDKERAQAPPKKP